MNIINVKQEAGFGDILLVLKLVHFLADEYDFVKFKINPGLWDAGIKQLILPSNVEIGPNIFPKPGEKIYNCSQYQTSIEDLMQSKYYGVDCTHEDWQSYVKINRNEDELEPPEEPFILINENYGFDISCSKPKKHYGVYNTVSNNLKIVEMKVMDGITLFDWIPIIEKAEEVHTVDTSICYLIETLNTTDKLFCHTRHPTKFTTTLKNIWKKPWHFYDYSKCTKNDWKKIVPDENF